jgi:hypothetical protein
MGQGLAAAAPHRLLRHGRAGRPLVVVVAMMHVLALETPNGAITEFSSPMPWATGTMTPTVNGRTLTEGYTILNNWTVQFTEAPRYDDVVGFFLTPAVS